MLDIDVIDLFVGSLSPEDLEDLGITDPSAEEAIQQKVNEDEKGPKNSG